MTSPSSFVGGKPFRRVWGDQSILRRRGLALAIFSIEGDPGRTQVAIAVNRRRQRWVGGLTKAKDTERQKHADKRTFMPFRLVDSCMAVNLGVALVVLN
jgi:hypothetical protein